MFDLTRYQKLGYQEYLDQTLMTTLSSTTMNVEENNDERRGGDLKQIARLAAANLVLPFMLQVLFSWGKQSLPLFDVLGTITCFILDDH